MPQFLLIRHAETDWSEVNDRQFRGFQVDFARLTSHGLRQADELGRSLASAGIDRLVSSPYTRALQTASSISKWTNLPVQVELDLREWACDRDGNWTSVSDVETAYEEYKRNRLPKSFNWEEREELANRLQAVLKRHGDASKVALVTHGVAIEAITGLFVSEAETISCEMALTSDLLSAGSLRCFTNQRR